MPACWRGARSEQTRSEVIRHMPIALRVRVVAPPFRGSSELHAASDRRRPLCMLCSTRPARGARLIVGVLPSPCSRSPAVTGVNVSGPSITRCGVQTRAVGASRARADRRVVVGPVRNVHFPRFLEGARASAWSGSVRGFRRITDLALVRLAPEGLSPCLVGARGRGPIWRRLRARPPSFGLTLVRAPRGHGRTVRNNLLICGEGPEWAASFSPSLFPFEEVGLFARPFVRGRGRFHGGTLGQSGHLRATRHARGRRSSQAGIPSLTPATGESPRSPSAPSDASQ